MSDPYALALSVTAADGRITRWGGDELNAKDVPTGLTFSTSIPGGFKAMSHSLLRRIDIDYSDEALFDSVRVYGPGNETVWEGRMMQFPRQHAEESSVNPGAVGWAAHLLDDPSFREIYIDRDLGKWDAPSARRQLALLTGSHGFAVNLSGQTQVVPDDTTGLPGLVASFSRLASTAVDNPATGVEAWYVAPPALPISSVYYDWTSRNLGVSATGWFVQIITAAGDDHDAPNTSTTLNTATTSGTGFHIPAATTESFATVHVRFGQTAAVDGDWRAWFRNLTVYGRHGLSRRGTDPGGYYASDIIANILRRTAPLLTYTAGTSISPTTFVIPHLVFTDPVTAEDAINLVNGYHLYEWGVYEDREFFWRPPDPERCTWEARLSDGAQLSLEGDDANNIFNGVFVVYTDPARKRKTVGPNGSSADLGSAALVDSSSTNPVNAHGIPRRWGLLEVTNTTTSAGAIQLGSVWLAENNLPTRRGQLTLTGKVHHPTQGDRPVWAVRAGDYIRIADRPDDPVRRIIETSYDHDTRRLTASLDQTVFKIEAIMERMGVNLIGRI